MNKHLKQFLLSSVMIVLVSIIMFVFVEGFFSIYWVIKTYQEPRNERAHTQYDELLGWSSIPNAYVKDLYGKDVYLKINSQGFRSKTDFPQAVPKGKIRVICSGDSFTLGYGVDNDHAWCQLLSGMDPRLETVNMGQGAFGVDQSYLWYMRDGIKLTPNVHIFAFIADDFYRMGGVEFSGYDKPYVKLEDNKLVVTNVPVPKKPEYLHWITNKLDALKDLRTVQVFQGSTAKGRTRERSLEESEQVALKMFDELLEKDTAKHCALMLVYLPSWPWDFDNRPDTLSLRHFLKVELKKRGILFLDLTEDFRKIPEDKIDAMFRMNHYSNAGNQLAAEKIYQTLSPLLPVKVQ